MRNLKPKTSETISETLSILKIERRTMGCHILGTTPLVMNRMIKKVREELLLPRRKQNKAQRSQTLKHDPIAEFNESIYRCRDEHAPTLVHMPNGAFKKAIAQAAVDLPGDASRAQIGRLVQVVDSTVHLFGLPRLYLDVVRTKGINHSPDIRTRALFPEWACKLTLGYVPPILTEREISNLLAAAGLFVGVGDGRTEKGSRDNGGFKLVGANDKMWHSIVKSQGRAKQIAAMKAAEPWDQDTEELLAFFKEELVRREQEGDVEDDDYEIDGGNGRADDAEGDEAAL